jgi:hypothetical protein
MQRDLNKLIHDNDQDRAACDTWMRNASPQDIAAVWNATQQSYKSGVMELMSRFAALALGEAMARKLEKEKE